MNLITKADVSLGKCTDWHISLPLQINWKHRHSHHLEECQSNKVFFVGEPSCTPKGNAPTAGTLKEPFLMLHADIEPLLKYRNKSYVHNKLLPTQIHGEHYVLLRVGVYKQGEFQQACKISEQDFSVCKITYISDYAKKPTAFSTATYCSPSTCIHA